MPIQQPILKLWILNFHDFFYPIRLVLTENTKNKLASQTCKTGSNWSKIVKFKFVVSELVVGYSEPNLKHLMPSISTNNKQKMYRFSKIWSNKRNKSTFYTNWELFNTKSAFFFHSTTFLRLGQKLWKNFVGFFGGIEGKKKNLLRFSDL